MELEDDQRAALRAGSKQVRRVAALVRSVNPESIRATEAAKRICELAWGCKAREPAVEEVVNAFAGLLRFAPTMGPGTQEIMQAGFAELIERLGLTREVERAASATAPGVVTSGRGSLRRENALRSNMDCP